MSEELQATTMSDHLWHATASCVTGEVSWSDYGLQTTPGECRQQQHARG